VNEEIEKELKVFKSEIEEKHSKSEMNKKYKFPRKFHASSHKSVRPSKPVPTQTVDPFDLAMIY